MIVRTNVAPPAVVGVWPFTGLRCVCGRCFRWRAQRRYTAHLVAEHPAAPLLAETSEWTGRQVEAFQAEWDTVTSMPSGRGVDWCPGCGSRNKFIRGKIAAVLLEPGLLPEGPPEHFADGTCNDDWHYRRYPQPGGGR